MVLDVSYSLVLGQLVDNIGMCLNIFSVYKLKSVVDTTHACLTHPCIRISSDNSFMIHIDAVCSQYAYTFLMIFRCLSSTPISLRHCIRGSCLTRSNAFPSLRNRRMHLFGPPNVFHISALDSRYILLSLDEIHSEHHQVLLLYSLSCDPSQFPSVVTWNSMLIVLYSWHLADFGSVGICVNIDYFIV